ncbi:MAG: RagB/SusD family nutrient uptake outer membrane protein [Bacteroidetes bacterium]|nr:RagB/SusD family nutrient uptake outer membrane protein [Bacteroidota bacterium]
MKKYIYILFSVLFVLPMASCDSFLDRQETEALTFDAIWKTRSNTQKYWLNAMSFLPNDEADFNLSPWLGASDEGTVTYSRDHRSINFGSWNPSNVPYYQMGQFYRGIREVNIFLQNADKCLENDPALNADELNEWKVQARFARAYYYFLMMRIYGPVFLVGDELLDFTQTTQALERPRNTWDDCVKYVVSEMNACIADPSMKESYSTGKYGYATRGACQAVISRLELYSARDLFNGNHLYASVKNPDGTNLFPQAYDATKWLESAKSARKIIDSGLYKLYRKAGDEKNYLENYYGITNVTWNSELIWTTGYKGLFDIGVLTCPTGVAGIAYGGVGPTQQQVDAYAMANGKYPITGYRSDGSPIIDENSGYSASEFTKTTWNYPAWGGGAAYSISAPNMYKNREPRFYVSVFFGSAKWIYGSSTLVVSFAKGANSNKSHDYPKSGYLINRFYDHTQNSANGQWGNITFPTFRLGEIYLNFIESVLECKKRNVDMPSDYETKAMEVWNELRDRVGLPAIMTVYPTATTEELIELCRKERRIELAFENHRYFDTRTWMIAEQTDSGPMYGMDVTVTGSGTTTPDGFWKRTVFETRVFKKNHYLYPFSQRELDRNKQLTQNFGW